MQKQESAKMEELTSEELKSAAGGGWITDGSRTDAALGLKLNDDTQKSGAHVNII
ncbi:MAG: hypothetical protein IJS28_00170 [Synergistaceae bacterium]|nr:hypothetical protein [Synergistaceae bacterium]